MEMSSSQLVPAPQNRVWEALNDPEVLKACITGCESIEKTRQRLPDRMAVKVGPVSAKFKGKMQLTDLNPLDSYSMNFDGQGGAAGFAKGQADVKLSPEGSGTRLAYTAKAQIGGKLAQIGSRLVDGAAKKTADDFFVAFTRLVGGPPDAAQVGAGPDAAESVTPTAPAAQGGSKMWLWIAVAIAVVAAISLVLQGF